MINITTYRKIILAIWLKSLQAIPNSKYFDKKQNNAYKLLFNLVFIVAILFVDDANCAVYWHKNKSILPASKRFGKGKYRKSRRRIDQNKTESVFFKFLFLSAKKYCFGKYEKDDKKCW